MKVLNLIPFLEFENSDFFKQNENLEILSITPFEQNLGKFIKCEIGSLSFVLAMICARFSDSEYFKNLDDGFLSGESNVGEEEIDEILEFLDECDCLIVDENLIKFHIDNKNIIEFLNLISSKFKIKILDENLCEINLQSHLLTPLKDLLNYDGAVIFKHTKNNKFTGGKYFCMVAKIKDGDFVKISSNSLEVTTKFELDENLKGTIALLGVDIIDSYKFELVKISKV
ncbi:hypothetical protein F1B92_00635 [Campylobacter sp. FMV-PI01]|uniref:NADH dehydrogenase n=1 Tax=Campylobacter portucalensis TaxID=2608384 RepID=A0A6L5WFB4_9BACT|nr:hypothetical protein [Campylobacter portucalensis]MSN95718.1 hypothetical protein [Campylobacter portucalensis]